MAAQHDRAQEVGHGDIIHAQYAVHGGVGRVQLQCVALLDLIPNCETPGFDLVSANAVKVWMALFDHARRLGLPHPPRSSEIEVDQCEPCLYCIWTVELLTRLLGLSRNTVGSALMELNDLGWIKKSTIRNKGGLFSGFEYMIMPPPEKLSSTARHRYAEKVDKKFQDATEAAVRLRKLVPDYQATPDPDEPLPDPFVKKPSRRNNKH